MKIENCMSCNSCNSKERLLHVEIGIFKGILCQSCYIMKMLENICQELKIKIGIPTWKKE